jgi:nitroimidazol reductase NimA-like FMN-containing flavoprotein (pyridoxamine 5'-phosphate oxidase superfamily)
VRPRHHATPVDEEEAVSEPGPIDDELLTAWLARPRFCVVTSLRKDGTPFGVTLGYHYEDRHLYLTIGKRLGGRPTSGIARLTRNPNVSIVISSEPARGPDDWTAEPLERRPSALMIHGPMERVDDPGDRISRIILERYLGPVLTRPGELDEFREHWLGLDDSPESTTGRVVFRIRVDEETAAGGPLGRRPTR